MNQAKTLSTAGMISALLIGLFGLSALVATSDTINPSLFVMTAPTAQINPHAKDQQQFTVKLSHVNTAVTYFTDRPKRVAGSVTMEEFLQIWTANKLNKSNNRPNVSMVSYIPHQDSPNVYVFELNNPQYNAKTGTITFEAKSIGETAPPQKAVTNIQRASLFIDDIGWHGNKFKPHSHG